LRRVLVLEDDHSNMHVFRSILARDRHTVFPVSTSQQAVDVCREQRGSIDLFIADVMTQEISGIATAVEILQFCPGLKVLFVSGSPTDCWSASDVNSFEILRSSHAVDFLQKPFGPAEFIDRVRNLIQKEPPLAAHQPEN
jgi:CheY-like chemotaxis protein